MSSTSAQTSTRSPVSVAGSQLIWYSFSWLLCVSLCHSPHAHTSSEHAHSPYACVTAVRHLLFRIFSLGALTLSAVVCFRFALRCGATSSSAAVSDQRILQLLCVNISMNWPPTTRSCNGQKDFKVAGSWVTWHIHFLFWDSVLVPVEALAVFLIRAEVHV